MTTVNSFTNLGLIEPLTRAVAEQGYQHPTPIQSQAIPPLLQGHDLLGCAQTGTGKTAAFALSVLQRLQQDPLDVRVTRALILTPTRELAAQIHTAFNTYGQHLPLTSAVIYGGVPQRRQEKALKRRPEILVATPGRLLDLEKQKLVRLHRIEAFVLDEADRMLDMGFIHDVRRIINLLPANRQNLFFSATMPPAVTELADSMLQSPIRVDIAPKVKTAENIDQHLLYVDKPNKIRLLQKLLEGPDIERALVFSRTKHGADRICRQLLRKQINVAAIHGNKSQNARTKALEGFRNGDLRALVATDIAARGIDVDDITHVINLDLPNEPESYVHRIGRTARAGRNGCAMSFCAAGELAYLRDIEKLINRPIPVNPSHAYHSEEARSGMENGQPAQTPGKKQSSRPVNNTRKRKPRSKKTVVDSDHARPAEHSGSGSRTGSRSGARSKSRSNSRSQSSARSNSQSGSQSGSQSDSRSNSRSQSQSGSHSGSRPKTITRRRKYTVR